jgi:hypothetical protein
VFYFSYDKLINDPAYSISKLAEVLNLNSDESSLKRAIDLIDKKLLRNMPKDNYLKDEQTKSTFNKLNDICFN